MVKMYIEALSEIWQELLFKVAGTLFPFYVGAIILYFINPSEVQKVFDPQSFVLYSATFIFSTFYLWYKTLDTKKTGIVSLLIFLIIAIVIALLYSFSLVDFQNTSSIDSWSYFVFGLTLLCYAFYECKNYIVVKNTKFYSNTESEYSSLDSSFENYTEDEQ